MNGTMATGASVPGRWAMAVRGFCCQNIAIGCAFGGFGIAVLPMQEQFGVSRATATLGLPLMVLAMGLASPLAAVLMGRIGLRKTMALGAILSAIGYVVLALAGSIAVVLAAFGLLIGVGAALFGPFPASVLASNWFQPSPGRAVGFVNVPLLAVMVPVVGVPMIERFGLDGFFYLLAALHLLLLPVLPGVVDRPAGDAAAEVRGVTPVPQGVIATGPLLRQPIFWVLAVGAGLLSAIGITASANLFAFVRENGGSASAASLTLSLCGGASMIGSLLVGTLCDRIGAARSLALLAIGLALSWAILWLTTSLPPAFAAAILIGTCGAGVFPAVNVLAGHLYGPASLPRVVGLFSLLTLPLTFCLPPLAGVLHDAGGGYAPVAATIAAISAGVALTFFASTPMAQRQLSLRRTSEAIA